MIDWKLYPEHIPQEMNRYLISVMDGENESRVDIGYFAGNRFINENDKQIKGIVAWADLPKPYVGESEMHLLIGYKERMYRIAQDRRGMGTEADVVITLRGTEVYRRAFPRVRDIESLRLLGVHILTEMDKNDNK